MLIARYFPERASREVVEILVKQGLENWTQKKAAKRFLCDIAGRAPRNREMVIQVLQRAAWTKDKQAAFEAAKLLMDRFGIVDQAVVQGVVNGGLKHHRHGDASMRLMEMSTIPEVKSMLVLALEGLLYEDNTWIRHVVAPILVRLGAKLTLEICSALTEEAEYFPAVPIAALVLSGRIEETRKVATDLERAELLEMLGTEPYPG